MNKFAEANKRIEEAVVDGYKRIENGVVSGYKNIEDGAVSGYKKVENWFVENFFIGEMESVEEAKARMKRSVENKRNEEEEK